MSLADFQRSVISLLFARDPEPHVRAVSADALSEKRWRVYRRMVRSRLRESIDDVFVRTRAAIGEEKWDALVDRFLHESPPKTPYLRAVPGEVAAFVVRALDASAPAWTKDLAAYEWALREVAVLADERGADETEADGEVTELRMDRPVVLSPAHRVLRLEWSVHRDPVERGRSLLCLYRDPETHRVRVLEITPVAAAILEELGRGDRPLVEALRVAAEREGVTIDANFVESFADVADDWIRRGLWLGSRRET